MFEDGQALAGRSLKRKYTPRENRQSVFYQLCGHNLAGLTKFMSLKRFDCLVVVASRKPRPTSVNVHARPPDISNAFRRRELEHYPRGAPGALILPPGDRREGHR